MEKYELLYVLPAKYTEEELGVLSAKIKGIVENLGGTKAEETHMGKRKLSYPIKHFRYGHYYLIIFEAEKEAIAKMNATLRLNADLLRHLIIKRDPYLQGVPKLAEEMHIVRRDDRKERDKGGRRRPSAPQQAPLQQQPSGESTADRKEGAEKESADKISIDDLDKKLDKILTDDIV